MAEDTREQGGCQCGAVRFRFDRSQVVGANHCHCRDCQHATGSAFATFCMVPSSGIVLEGAPKAYTVPGASGQDVTRSFCAECGSQLFSVVGVMPGFHFIKAGSLDDASWLEPASDFWASSRQPWIQPLTGVVHAKNPG